MKDEQNASPCRYIALDIHRVGLRRGLDQALHPLPPKAPPKGHGRGGNTGFHHPPRNRTQGCRLHTEPGAQRHPLPISHRLAE